MAINAFLQIDGIQGESLDSQHVNWIEVASFSQSISQPASLASPSGGAAGKVVHGEFVIVKHIDVASPKLYEACATGKHLANAVLEVGRSAAAKVPVKYIVVRMQDVIISSVSLSEASGGEAPVESISLNYGAMQWTYTPQKADGSAGTDVTGSWKVS
jgi:type VI secretion system secreted protein Hcp